MFFIVFVESTVSPEPPVSPEHPVSPVSPEHVVGPRRGDPSYILYLINSYLYEQPFPGFHGAKVKTESGHSKFATTI